MGTIICDPYIRYSDLREENLDEEGRAKNIDNAIELLKQRATQLGWRIGEVIVENDVKADGKLKPASAYKRKTVTLPNGEKVRRVIRPGFTRLVDRLKAGAAQAVLALDLDRLVRDPRDLEDFIDVCQTTRANARSLSGSLTFTDGGTDSEITMARIMVAVANKSSRDMTRRQKVAHSRKRRAGEFGGGPRPYGREADGITVYEPEAKIIREACRRVLAGISLRSQCVSLNEASHRTATGSRFKPADFRDMLLRPSNAGLRLEDGQIVREDPDRAIVPRDEWEAVRDKLADPDRRTCPGPSNKYLGTGIFRCWCGETVLPRVRNGRTRRPPSYACKAPRADGERHVVRIMRDVDAWVVDNVLARLSQPDAADLVAPRAGASVDVAALRTEIRLLRERKVTLAKLFIETGDTEALIAGKRAIDDQLAQKTEVLRAATEVSPLENLIGADDVRKVWDNMTIGDKRAVLKLVCRVEIWPLDHGDRRFDRSAVRVMFNV